MEYKAGDIIMGYKIIKEFKNGGMSNVYLAENMNTGIDSSSFILEDNEKYGVVKVISKLPYKTEKEKKTVDDQWNRAKTEYELTFAIQRKWHPNVAKPINWTFSKDEDSYIIITEYVNGPSLSSFISSQKALTINKAIYYFKKILDGVKFFHHLDEDKTIIHRDLKTDNIMLTKDLREIKIIDYGIASSFYQNKILETENAEGTIYCTANYTTPDVLKLNGEILKGVREGNRKSIEKMKEVITPQFDFHALGVILFEMLTGDFPFTSVKNESDVRKIKNYKQYDIPLIRNLIPNTPNSIENIIFRCTASKPSDIKYRYKSIDELIDDLSSWDSPDRMDEPLIKPIEKRNFQQPKSFDVSKLKDNEFFYTKWWFYGIICFIFVTILIVCTVVLIVI